MTTEFNLSEKIRNNSLIIEQCVCDAINLDDVKEFIRLLKDDLCREDKPAPKDCTCWTCSKIKKLAGEKLK